MIQDIIVYVILGCACFYLGYKIYAAIKKEQACNKCELMKAVKTKK